MARIRAPLYYSFTLNLTIHTQLCILCHFFAGTHKFTNRNKIDRKKTHLFSSNISSMATETAKKSSFEVHNSQTHFTTSLQKTDTIFYVIQIIFRILAIIFTVCAISILVTAKQTVNIFTRITATYKVSSSSRFLLGANAAVLALSVLSLVGVVVLSRRGLSKPLIHFLLFLHDMVVMVLMISGCAAATAVGYVGKYGEATAAWIADCDFVGKFCHQTLISIVFSYLAFFCYLALTVLSAHKLYASTTH